MKSIMELAEQAGFEIDCCSLQWHERIERFAHLVRQQALKEAMELANAVGDRDEGWHAYDAAAAIWALKEST
jgi:hypothetical protein